MTHLIVAPCCLDYGSTKSGCNANGYATNHATHKDIPQHALLSISNNTEFFNCCENSTIRYLPWSEVKDDNQCRDDKNTSEGKETRRYEELLKYSDFTNGWFLWTFIEGYGHYFRDGDGCLPLRAMMTEPSYYSGSAESLE